MRWSNTCYQSVLSNLGIYWVWSPHIILKARLFPFSSTNHTYLSIKTTVRNPFMAKIPRFLLSHNTSINTRRNALVFFRPVYQLFTVNLVPYNNILPCERCYWNNESIFEYYEVIIMAGAWSNSMKPKGFM